VAAGEEAVLGRTIERVAGLEDQAEVLDGFAVVVRNGRADAGSRKIVATANAAGFVVIPHEKRSIFVSPNRLKPYRLVFRRVEIYAFRICKLELVRALAARGHASRVKDVKFAVGPHGGGVAVDDLGKNDSLGGLDIRILAVAAEREEC